MDKTLTSEMVRRYIDCQGAHCPYCQSSEIEAGKVEADGASAWSQVTCNECGKEWQDVFFLGAVDVIDENGVYGDTIMPTPGNPDSHVTIDPPAPACPPSNVLGV
jgi:hypothetical protein